MKKILVAGMLLSSLMLGAKEKVEKVEEVVSSKYNRTGLSIVFVNRPNGSDVKNFCDTVGVPDKFDHNVIATKFLNVDYEGVTPVLSENISACVQDKNLGKEIMSYVFNRQENGTFDDARILERGLYDAKDQDIRNSAAAKVKDLSFEWGEPLVNSSYVVVVDFYNSATKTEKDVTSYEVKANAHAYKLNAGREVLDNFYATAWADVTYSDADRVKAMKAYDAMAFDLEYITTVSVTGTSSSGKYVNGSMAAACQGAYDNVIYELEKKITAWKVATSIVAVRPLAAKIGKKEGVKNGARFQAYTYKENKDGELVSVKRGMLRATVVTDNRGVSTGNTQPSYFYQISGAANIKEGYTIQQKNDLKLGASLALGLAPLGFRAGLDMDYIAHIGKRGAITYGMINLGANMGHGMTLFDAMIGAGYGIPLSRFFEVTPFIMGGAYLNGDFKAVAYLAEPGVRAALTFQPFALYLSLGYQVSTLNLVVPDLLPIEAKFGIKWTF
jgi:hypothetical protein